MHKNTIWIKNFFSNEIKGNELILVNVRKTWWENWISLPDDYFENSKWGKVLEFFFLKKTA
jgi:hypothetical protein